MTEIKIDIETLPSELKDKDNIIDQIIESGEAKCNMTKPQLIEHFGDPKLKYKTAGELSEMWIAENKIEAAEGTYRARSLDGSKGIVCSWVIGYDDDVEHYCFTNDYQSEETALETLAEALSVLCGRKDGGYNQPLLIAHNAPFDLKFLHHRFIINNIPCPIKFKFGGWHDRDYFCTMQAWCGREGRISQDNLCKILGIEGKPADINGANLYEHAVKGNWPKILEYNIDDVRKLTKIYNRLK